ncbi:MAG: acyl-CoA dehydrogenase family protein [Dehalococcoidia bacterium]
MIDFTATQEQRMLLDMVRRFRREYIDSLEPHKREWIEDAAERFPWHVVEAGSRLGLRTLATPVEYGGGGASVLTLCMVLEELAAGDMGVAIIFDQTWKFTGEIVAKATTEQKDWFFPMFVQDDRFLLASGIVEPEHGSDTSLSRYLATYEGRPVSLETTARLENGQWVISGRKMMPSLGSTAKLVLVQANTEPGRPIHEGTSTFLVPTDTPGFRVEHVWDKISQRLVDNATIVFEGCQVPEDYLLGRRGEGRASPYIGGGNVEAGATTLGTARATYEAALEYARQRVQGARPIIEHQAIGMMLAEMATELEAARMLIWRAAVACDQDLPEVGPLRAMAKWFPAEVAVRVCLKAMEVFGGLSIMREMPVQKHLRDCLSFLHSDGTQQSRKMLIQHHLLGAPAGMVGTTAPGSYLG